MLVISKKIVIGLGNKVSPRTYLDLQYKSKYTYIYYLAYICGSIVIQQHIFIFLAAAAASRYLLRRPLITLLSPLTRITRKFLVRSISDDDMSSRSCRYCHTFINTYVEYYVLSKSRVVYSTTRSTKRERCKAIQPLTHQENTSTALFEEYEL